MSLGDGDAVAEELLALSSKDATERCQTLLELASYPDSLPELWPYLEDPDATVRVAAVHALWQTGTGQHALDRLVQVLRAALAPPEEAPTPHDAALMAGTVLQNIGPPAVRPLTEDFQVDTPSARYIVLALADIGTDEAIRFLRRVAEGSSSEAAQEALRALRDLDPRPEPKPPSS